MAAYDAGGFDFAKIIFSWAILDQYAGIMLFYSGFFRVEILWWRFSDGDSLVLSRRQAVVF